VSRTYQAMGLAAVLIAFAGAAGASEGPALGYSNLLVGRVNPLGLKDDFTIHLRRKLFASDSIVLRDAYGGGSFLISAKPTAVQLGFGGEIQPLSILRLSASIEWVNQLTAFDNVLSFPSPRAEHDDATRESLGKEGENYATRGLYITLGALLQVKLGPVAVRSDLKAAYVRVDLRGSDTVFYEIEWDLLSPDRGWVMFNNTDVVFLADFGLLAGVRYSLAHAFYDDDTYRAGEPRKNVNTPIHKIGPVIGYTFKVEGERFQKPTLLAIAGWYLEHRYRTGRDTSQAIPCVILAFSFSGTLLWRTT